MRSFTELRNVDPGFEPYGILVADMVVSGMRYDSGEEYLGFRDRLAERPAALPEVTGVSTSKQFPTRGMGEEVAWALPGDAPSLPGEERTAMMLHIRGDYFEVMGIPVVRGTAPMDDVVLSVVINERLAREAFGGIDAALGQTLRMQGTDVPVGAVVGDVLHADPAAEAPAMVYLDDRITSRRVFSFVMRTDGDPLDLVEPFRATLAALDPDQPVRSVYTARSAYDAAVGQPRFFAFLMTLFATTAAGLAAIGIYGMIAYSVRRRTRELGVRVALGADRGGLRRMVIREAMLPVVPGILVGLAGAAALSSLLSNLLFEVGRLDGVTYLSVGAGLGIVALLAAWAAAREATRVDPQVALRSE